MCNLCICNKWTKTTPTAPGLYWWQQGKKKAVYLIEIYRSGQDGTLVRGVDTNVYFAFEWDHCKPYELGGYWSSMSFSTPKSYA